MIVFFLWCWNWVLSSAPILTSLLYDHVNFRNITSTLLFKVLLARLPKTRCPSGTLHVVWLFPHTWFKTNSRTKLTYLVELSFSSDSGNSQVWLMYLLQKKIAQTYIYRSLWGFIWNGLGAVKLMGWYYGKLLCHNLIEILCSWLFVSHMPLKSIGYFGVPRLDCWSICGTNQRKGNDKLVGWPWQIKERVICL